MMALGKYSFGVGDRFGKEGKAQLDAILKIQSEGVAVTPVWNKSNREHQTVGTQPQSLREEADSAVKTAGFKSQYFVDADHINIKTVKPFLEVSNFFTIDVAEFIGKSAPEEEEEGFLNFFKAYSGDLHIPGIERKMQISKTHLREMLNNFLLAAKNAGEVYSYIQSKKEEYVHIEVSIDEVEEPQSPVELFFILAALAYYKVPVNTIAPKFTGSFNKGVDYEGDLEQFEREFEEDLLVLKFAVKEFDLQQDLKISVHSGSDKFSVYPVIRKLISKHDAGLHLKTAGTTWLEELIGLAESEGEGFNFSKELYRDALERYDELTRDYKSVLSIDRSQLPAPDEFSSGKQYAAALRHEPNSPESNPHFRQLLHCAYKIAAEKGDHFFPLLDMYRERVENNVTDNLFRKHLAPLFLSPHEK
ncbi:tagaturonate epimerase family protein [Salinimicrobium sp. MT39]|uniref:Tagaturonate/fructuronate epimerase n=1 Tax=Salinimicrobium profundisediminis TaxID=2994553 RepID=A0A9X3I158_9FLAO|nr:tagaturonate epimerase family protein [Salinimicrobium profundisediminis]MCX2838249.1 tagaturonate epimerase family protein [Salinimicrobium profundisediminis]